MGSHLSKDLLAVYRQTACFLCLMGAFSVGGANEEANEQRGAYLTGTHLEERSTQTFLLVLTRPTETVV